MRSLILLALIVLNSSFCLAASNSKAKRAFVIPYDAFRIFDVFRALCVLDFNVVVLDEAVGFKGSQEMSDRVNRLRLLGAVVVAISATPFGASLSLGIASHFLKVLGYDDVDDDCGEPCFLRKHHECLVSMYGPSCFTYPMGFLGASSFLILL